VPDVDALYQAFSDGIKAHYGKRLTAGIPRMTALRDKADGGRGFNVIDPGGNWIRISQMNPTGADAESSADKTPLSKLARATQAADLLADSNGDFPAAAAMLDKALGQSADAPVADRIPALVARAGIAISMDDLARAGSILAEVRQLPLSDAERHALSEVLERAADLESMLN
jgi:hypothetical protein